MWAVMKAPLLIGTDVTNMTAATLATLTNPEVIAVNQDALGIQARLLPSQNSSSASLAWVGPLVGGDKVALLVNNNLRSKTLTFRVTFEGGPYNVRDLWSRKTSARPAVKGDTIAFSNVGAHDCVLLRFSKATDSLSQSSA